MRAKTICPIPRWLLLLLVAGCFMPQVYAQSSKSQGSVDLAAAVEQKQFVFVVTMIRPSKGRKITSNDGYSLKVANDSVVSDLPYIGRVYQATLPSDNNGFKGVSTNHDYKSDPRKKGGWSIQIKPKDLRSINSFRLTVYDDATATLDVIANDRESISYSGRIKPVKPQ